VKTASDTGASCALSVRLRAVTTIFSRPPTSRLTELAVVFSSLDGPTSAAADSDQSVSKRSVADMADRWPKEPINNNAFVRSLASSYAGILHEFPRAIFLVLVSPSLFRTAAQQHSSPYMLEYCDMLGKCISMHNGLTKDDLPEYVSVHYCTLIKWTRTPQIAGCSCFTTRQCLCTHLIAATGPHRYHLRCDI
jgi:hypothetical protein